ncbi:hypothetical protein DH2020_012357 [Rehmannia glutinosa]|uniref:CLAVATA3/ESR (CLE)-related protein n=1 Tax=Rehmannia glutinosa TaxID=99300 RepID=A0ABR0X0H6_REHGL
MFLFFVLALVIVSCMEIQFSEGRQLKSGKNADHKDDLFQVSTGLEKMFRRILNNNAHFFERTSPGNSPGVGHHLPGQKDDYKGRHRYVLNEGYDDSFRPTTPGNSPGIGHSKHD